MKKKRIWQIIVVAIVLAIIVPIVGLLMFRASENTPEPLRFSIKEQIEVGDGVASPQESQTIFAIEKTGDYVFNLKWEATTPGMITGVSITDSLGNIVFTCTAESCMIESNTIHLTTGIYNVKLQYLTNEDSLTQFLQDNEIEILNTSKTGEPEAYEYASNLHLDMDYSFEVVNEQSFSYGKRFGLFCGIVIAFFLIFVMCSFTTNGSGKYEYDERQEVMRGRAFKYGFFTLMAWNVLIGILYCMEIPLPATEFVALMLGVVLGVLVYAAYCIWADAYFALNEYKKVALIGLGTASALNLLIGFSNIVSGKLLEDGKLGIHSLNLTCGLTVLILMLLILIKMLVNKKDSDVKGNAQENEEDDDSDNDGEEAVELKER